MAPYSGRDSHPAVQELPNTDDVLRWLRAAWRTWPEPVQLPDDLEADLPLPYLAEARSRLADMSEVARAVRRAVDGAILTRIGPHGAIRWGDRLLMPGDHKTTITDPTTFFRMLLEAIERTPDDDDRAALLAALINASEVKLGGLKRLAQALGFDPADRATMKTFRETLTTRSAKPTSDIKAITERYWPNWALHMADGEAHVTANRGFDTYTDDDDREPPQEEE